MIHFGQGIRSNLFRQYDLGFFNNIFRYGWISPPNYNLGNVRAPVSLYYSSNDLLSEPVDVDKLWLGLSNPVHKIKITDPKFNHFDYIWAIDQRKLVYNRVISIMRSYEQGVSKLSDKDLSKDIDNLTP